MSAVIRFPDGCNHGGSIRVGPRCHAWFDPYEHLLAFEIEGDLAIVGGLTWPISRADYRDVVNALAHHGLRAAMDRAKPGRKPYRVILAVP